MNQTATLPATIAPQELTPEQSNAWLGMAVAKNNLVADLTRQELAAQSLLQSVPDTHEAIDAAMAEYRKAHTNMVETRKTFTGLIDAGIVQPLMAFEKRVDPKVSEAYNHLSNRSLALRKAAADAAAKVNAINQEIASFKAHFQNEFFRIVAAYRADVRREIDAQYEYWLQQRISPEMPKIHAHLGKIEAAQLNRFNPVHMTPEQMQEAYATIAQPNWAAIYAEMCTEADRVFANFDSDMANAAAALAARREESAMETHQEQKSAADEAAINTLITTAEVVTVDTPTIKRTYQITVVESEQWAKTVMAAFITNLPALAKYIRVKSWAKLTIGQMAEYLAKLATESEVKAAGLTYQEVEK